MRFELLILKWISHKPNNRFTFIRILDRYNIWCNFITIIFMMIICYRFWVHFFFVQIYWNDFLRLITFPTQFLILQPYVQQVINFLFEVLVHKLHDVLQVIECRHPELSFDPVEVDTFPFQFLLRRNAPVLTLNDDFNSQQGDLCQVRLKKSPSIVFGHIL